MPINTSLTGINLAFSRIQNISNNIANASTDGFKESSIQSADTIASAASGASSNTIGQGVTLQSISKDFSQGILSSTGNSLDLAIAGQGFFVLSDSGEQTFSRSGNFQLNNQGQLVNSQGQALQGFQATDTGISSEISDLVVPAGGLTPQATEQVSLSLNLNAAASTPAETIPTDFTAADPPSSDSYNFTSSVEVYDSLGQERELQVFFSRSGTNEFTASFALDGNALDESTTLEFASDGQLISDSEFELNIESLANGAQDLSINVDFSDTTQFSSASSLREASQNGFGSADLASLEIDSSGFVSAQYSKGQSQVVGQVAIARFSAPDDLQAVGNNNFSETFASGNALISSPEASLAAVQSGFNELSNVDIAGNLVGLIQAQRDLEVNVTALQSQEDALASLINSFNRD